MCFQCKENLPAINNATLFLLCHRKLLWKSFSILVASVNGKNCPQRRSSRNVISKNCQNSYRKLSIPEHPENRFSANFIIPSANPLKVLTVVTATWEFTVGEKSKISASFLRDDVRDGVESKIFGNCNFYLGRAANKAFRQTSYFFLTTSAQREGPHNAATLYLLKSDSLRVGVFFGSIFSVNLAGVKFIFRNGIRNKFFASDKRCINKFFILFWPTSDKESTKAQTSSLYAMSVPTLISESS